MSALDESTAITDDGVALWTVRSGVGPVPVILCHGGPGAWDQMELVADMLDDLATVVRWDQRGCGRSAGDGPYTYARFLADLDTVRAHWGIEACVIGGHSAGASLALFYALEHPARTTALLYLSGTGLEWATKDGPAYRANREARMGAYLARWQELRAAPNPDAAEVKERALLSLAADFGDVATCLDTARAFDADHFDANMECNAALGAESVARTQQARTAIGELRVPTLVVHGALDPRPVPEHLVSVIPAAQMVILDEVGHYVWAQHPERLRSALRGFVHSLA